MSDDASVGSNGEEVGGDIDQWDDRTLNRTFDLLRDQQRRYVLKKLETMTDDVASVEDLVTYLLANDPDADGADRVTTALLHRTLPRLMDAGVVDFDARSDTVRYHGSELADGFLDSTSR